ncbi:MAG TPA: biopolymer transporter ExbD [Nevskiales bacterium]|nr:biopolymer transporter ExbD [Nevskiales bacterium]
MRFAPRPPEEPEINLISLVDVVFMLLIFFMVTTTFVRSSHLKLSLPQAQPAPVAQASEAIEVAVDADGRYYIDGRPLRDRSALTLERGLRQVGGDAPERPLVIRADARASHQAVVTVMDVAARSGYAHLSIATVPAR